MKPAALDEGQRSRLIKPPARDWLLLQWSPLGVLVGLLGYVSSRRIVVRGLVPWGFPGVIAHVLSVCYVVASKDWKTYFCFRSPFSSCHSICQYELLCKQTASQHNRLKRLRWKPLMCWTGWLLKHFASYVRTVEWLVELGDLHSVGIKHDVISHLSFWATWIYPHYVYTPSLTLQFSIFYYSALQ